MPGVCSDSHTASFKLPQITAGREGAQMRQAVKPGHASDGRCQQRQQPGPGAGCLGWAGGWPQAQSLYLTLPDSCSPLAANPASCACL